MYRLSTMMLAVVLAACNGGTTTETTTAPAQPTDVVADWLEAVVAGDAESLATLVEPTGLAVVAAVENNLRSEELVGLLNGGFEPDLAADYWAKFKDDFALIQGEPLSAVSVGNAAAVPGTGDFSVVTITTETTEGQIVLRRTDDGWQIDFAATVGPALVVPLGEYLESAIGGENGGEIAAAYSAAVVPALEAALELDTTNTTLEFGVEYIRQLVSV